MTHKSTGGSTVLPEFQLPAMSMGGPLPVSQSKTPQMGLSGPGHMPTLPQGPSELGMPPGEMAVTGGPAPVSQSTLPQMAPPGSGHLPPGHERGENPTVMKNSQNNSYPDRMVPGGPSGDPVGPQGSQLPMPMTPHHQPYPQAPTHPSGNISVSNQKVSTSGFLLLCIFSER